MFLKSKLEEKKNRLLSEYNTEPEKKLMSSSIEKKNKTQNFRLFHKNDRISFPLDHKKFNDECIPEHARIAKQYVKELIDPDILELRPKRWNNSSQPIQNEKPELKKTLFEVRNGLKDFKVTETKEKNIEVGTDTRNYGYEGWNGSNYLENREKKMISIENLDKAKSNTIKYWKNNNEYRVAETIGDLIEENQRNPKHRVFQKYINPVSKAINDNKLLTSIIRQTNNIREKLREKVEYENPAATAEKIEAIVYKEMFNTIKHEIKMKTGKVHIENKKNENIDYNPTFTKNEKNNETRKNPDLHSYKYPIDYETYKQIYHFRNEHELHDETIRDNELVNKSKTENKFGRVSLRKDSIYPPDYNAYKKTIEKKNLEVKEKNSLLEEEEHKRLENKQLPQLNKRKLYFDTSSESSHWIKNEYLHPGTYTVFKFNEKRDPENNPNNTQLTEKKMPAWSCCMNREKNSKGCQKTMINRLKWSLDFI